MAGTYHLPRSTPEAQGIASTAILAFIEAAERVIDALHSVMLVRHGHVVAEGWWAPYRAEQPHVLYSLSKSFTATAIGFAVAEGRLTLDDSVLAFFPDERPAIVSANLAAMRVRDLLTMTTGHAIETTHALWACTDGNWARAFLACPVEHAPGTHFVYNNGATYMLSAIQQRLTGLTLLEYLQPRLFTPLGITGATWQSCPRGINGGGFGLSLPTEAVAYFGQLYLQQGVWQGQQLLPSGWVAEASRFHSDNRLPDDAMPDWHQGYGYQFWRCRHNAYRADGAFAQFCVVLPDQDTVVAITSGTRTAQAVLDLVWEHMLPALGAPRSDDAVAYTALQQTLGTLTLPLPRSTAEPAAGILDRCFQFESNDPTPVTRSLGHDNDHRFSFLDSRLFALGPNALELDALGVSRTDMGWCLTLHDTRGAHAIQLGDGTWHRGETDYVWMEGSGQIAAAGAWCDAHTLQAQIYFDATPYCLRLTCRFADDTLQLEHAFNVSFAPTTLTRLNGRVVR